MKTQPFWQGQWEKARLLTGRVTDLTFYANEGREQQCDLSKIFNSTC